jgi:methylase of polypeptide subunit release factors
MAALVHGIANEPGKLSLVYPDYPTVYSPAVDNNVAQARNMGGHVHEALKALDPADGSDVLDVGTGSGYLSWVAWATGHATGRSLRMHALDINPLAVANAQEMARLAGFPLDAKVNDNVVDRDGHAAFPGTRFRFVIWDMPAIPHNPSRLLAQSDGRDGPRRLMTYWDDGLGAVESLRRFASALPSMLSAAPPPRETSRSDRLSASTAVVWNIIPDDGYDVVGETFRKAGLKTSLLDTYTSGRGTLRCVVYAVSRP